MVTSVSTNLFLMWLKAKAQELMGPDVNIKIETADAPEDPVGRMIHISDGTHRVRVFYNPTTIDQIPEWTRALELLRDVRLMPDNFPNSVDLRGNTRP